MPQGATLRVEGLSGFLRACAHADKDSETVRAGHVPQRRRHRQGRRRPQARPDQLQVGGRASRPVSASAASPSNSRSARRTGKRPDWGRTQMRKALLPAHGRRTRTQVVREFEKAIDKVADHFERGPRWTTSSSTASSPTTAATSSTSAAPTFTLREWGWIKRHSGYLPLTIDEGLAGSRRGADGGVRADRAGAGGQARPRRRPASVGTVRGRARGRHRPARASQGGGRCRPTLGGKLERERAALLGTVHRRVRRPRTTARRLLGRPPRLLRGPPRGASGGRPHPRAAAATVELFQAIYGAEGS